MVGDEDAVARKVVRDARLDRLRRRGVRDGTGGIFLPLLGRAAPVKRFGKLRIDRRHAS
jgi:hypothetical protein